MTTSMNCDMARDIFFELRHGRIEKEQRLAFETHIESCTGCREYVEKLDSMLDEALLWEPSDKAPSNRDSLFDGIVDAIETPDRSHRAPAVATSSDDDHDDEALETDEGGVSIPGLRMVLAIAAVIVAAIALSFLAAEIIDDRSPSTTTEETAVLGELFDVDSALPQPAPFPSTQTPESVHVSDSLRLSADDGSAWTLASNGDDWTLNAEKGTVVIEFLPRSDDETLQVDLAGVRGRVVGTILYVDADTDEIGVITGRVAVEPDGGDETTISSRQVWRRDGVHEIEQERWDNVTESIDVEEHDRQIQRRQAEPEVDPEEDPEIESGDEPEARTTEPSESDKRDPESAEEPVEQARGPVRLRMQAEEALRDRDFEAAADNYEKLLDILPAYDRAAGAIRLDLARIYQYEIDNPERTVSHLDYFIETWPDDAVTPRVISQLCGLVDDPDRDSRCRRR